MLIAGMIEELAGSIVMEVVNASGFMPWFLLFFLYALTIAGSKSSSRKSGSNAFDVLDYASGNGGL